MSCYEQFGWTPDDIARLSIAEANRLSIYFEELGAHNYRQNRKMQSQSSSSSSASSQQEVVALELKDEYYDDPDWWKDDEDEWQA